MTEVDAEILWLRAYRLAKSWGFRDAEDLAQSSILKMLEKPKRTVTQVVIDAIRDEHGATRYNTPTRNLFLTHSRFGVDCDLVPSQNNWPRIEARLYLEKITDLDERDLYLIRILYFEDYSEEDVAMANEVTTKHIEELRDLTLLKMRGKHE